jgi:tetratricopeptide (TPR) repeat protein
MWLPIVLAAALIVFLPSLGNQLLFDDEYLANGRLFADYASVLDVRPRMLSYGSFVWIRDVFGGGWWKQRLVNVAIHLGVVLALWAFYREILRHIQPPEDRAAPYAQSPALGMAIGFFALNPVSVYAVAYLIQRSILLATLFVVLALWLFALAVGRHKPWLLIAALACYLLGVMAKEYAILAPLAAVPVYILVARPSMGRLAALGVAGASLAGAAAFALSYRYGEIIGKPFDEYSHVYLAQLSALDPNATRNAFALSIENQAWLFFHYGFRWFLPVSEWMSVNLRPPFPITPLSFPHVLGIGGYLATVAGGFFLLIRHRDWRALLGLSLLLPALLFATEFVTVWVQDPFVLYRSYLWAIGVPGIVFIALHGTSVRALTTIGLIAGALLVWQALDRVASLATPVSAWTDAIAKLPNDPRSVGRWFPYVNRGAAFVEASQFNLAMQDFEAAAGLGDMGIGLVNRGSLFAANGEHLKALASFEHAERNGYSGYNLPFQRGLSLLALGQPADAYRQFELTRSMNPPSPTRELLLLNLGRTAMQLGRADDAIRSLQQLVAVEPGTRDGRYFLAMAQVMKGEHAGARETLDGLAREETSTRVHYARALANYGLKRKAEALADIQEAIRRGGETPHLREWRAKIEAMP